MKNLLLLVLVSCSSMSTGDATLFSKYETLMQKHPATEKIPECKPIDLNSHKLATKHKAELEGPIGIMIKPNFNGLYRLIDIQTDDPKGPTWLIADCRTGKFLQNSMIGSYLFSYESAMLIKNPPNVDDTPATYRPENGLPEVYTWDAGNLVKQENPIQ